MLLPLLLPLPLPLLLSLPLLLPLPPPLPVLLPLLLPLLLRFSRSADSRGVRDRKGGSRIRDRTGGSRKQDGSTTSSSRPSWYGLGGIFEIRGYIGRQGLDVKAQHPRWSCN